MVVVVALGLLCGERGDLGLYSDGYVVRSKGRQVGGMGYGVLCVVDGW